MKSDLFNSQTRFDTQRIWEIKKEDIVYDHVSMDLVMSSFFNVSHRVALPDDSYGNIHRHSFHLNVRARHFPNNIDSLMTPFATFRDILNELAKFYEGKYLNDLPIFNDLQPTTENFTLVLAHQIQQLALGLPLRIIEVTLNESPTVGVSITLHDD
ncbi:MAG: 6-carboxytetrahydropterin synthase [Anaerolineaceae bacterium]|nr:6-carboxytetrahydropterin synthase [Anaerolineaceae bacterium]